MTNKWTRSRSGLVVLLGLWAILQSVVLSAYGYPCPRGDDSVYKSPAVELATNGKMIIPGMTGAIKQAGQGFAHYPPVYQLVFATWYTAFGFSLHSSLLCAHFIHSLSALAIASVTWRILRSEAVVLPAHVVAFLSLGAGLFHLGNLAYFDRPEDLAVIFFVCLFHFVGTDRYRHRLGPCVAGIMIALAGLTAPWVGLLGGVFLCVYELIPVGKESPPSLIRLFRIGASGLVSLILVILWCAWMNAGNPGIVANQLFQGNLSYANEARPTSILNSIVVFANTLPFDSPRIAILAGLVFMPFRVTRDGLVHTERALLVTVIFGLVIVLLWRPTGYTYLGATVSLLVPIFFVLLRPFLYQHGKILAAGFAAVTICILSGQRDVLFCVSLITRTPQHLSANVCYQEIQETIPPGDLVGVSPRHWYALQNRNPWRELYFVSTRHESEIKNCAWLITYPGLGEPSVISQYEIAREKRSTFGSNDTYAYTIWKRRE